jgi:hypothetical protein
LIYEFIKKSKKKIIKSEIFHTMAIVEQWNIFRGKLKKRENLDDFLSVSCNESDIHKIEILLGLKFPDNLKAIYIQNNGQTGNVGIFKALSGKSKVSYPVFLSINQIIRVRKILIERNLDIFYQDLIPFACDSVSTAMDDVLCVDSTNEKVFLLWTSSPDWTLPTDWQTAKFELADNIENFIEKQIKIR